MTAILLDGTTYVAGLDWHDGTDDAAIARTARRGRYRWFVARERQTGWAPDQELHSEGMPSLAACVADRIPGDTWMALIEGEGGVHALVKVVDGKILADGDTAYQRRETALSEFERARSHGWGALFATAGLVEDAADFSAASLPREYPLRPAPRPGAGRRRAAQAVAAAAALAAVGAAALHLDDILGAFFPEPAPSVVRIVEARVPVEIDSVAFARACREAIRARPLLLPGWSVSSLGCRARLSEPALVEVSPGLRGRPALVVQWSLSGDRRASAYREIALAHLSSWTLAQVSGTTAWGVASLPPVIRAARERPPPLAWRRTMDRVVGPRVEQLQYADGAGASTVQIRSAQSLPRIERMLARAPGLEVTRLRKVGSEWQVDGRLAEPVEILESELDRQGIAPP